MERSSRYHRYLVGAVSVVLLSLLTGYLIGFSRSRSQNYPFRLLEKAYFEDRPLILRIGSTPHSAVRIQRGQQASPTDRPLSLIEAEASISRGLRTNPEDAQLLIARGEANLLEWSYEAAITDMQEALDTQPTSPTVLNGLAAAYFERAEVDDRFEDYGTAFELQSRALQHSPDDPIILFNRAISASRLFLYKQSIEDFQRYLAIDPTGGWSDEARQKLAEVHEIVETHDRRTKAPLLTPTEFVQQVDPSDPRSWDVVEPRIEEYLTTAITDWLPAAFPVEHEISIASDYKRALEILAQIVEKNHQDHWLRDLLAGGNSKAFPHAIAAVAKANHADNITEDYVLGREEARKAIRLFAQSHNTAGEIRARFEEIYSLQFSNAGLECLNKINAVYPLALDNSYDWIAIELQLEKYACASQTGDVDLSDSLVSAQRKAVNTAHYATLALRATGFLADDYRMEGKTEDIWKLCRTGLWQFWNGSVDPMRGYNLYSVLDVTSENDGRWHLDTAIDNQAIGLIDQAQNPLMLAVEYTSLAHAATLASDAETAQRALERAANLLTKAPKSKITRDYELSVDVYRARLDGESGRSRAGLDKLAKLDPLLDGIANENVHNEYHRVTGQLDTMVGETDAALKEFMIATSIAERLRSSLKSETDRISWANHWSETYRDLAGAKLRTNDPVGALAAWELYRGAAIRPNATAIEDDIVRGFTSTVVDSSLSAELGLLNQVLPRFDDRTVLVYSVFPNGLAIWAYNNRGVSERWVPEDPADLRMLATRLGELCGKSSSSTNAIQATAKRLYTILIAPIADNLRDEEAIVVEADDFLSAVPFQVLEDETGKYLVDRHPILYSPGLRYLGLPSEGIHRIDTGMRALVVANALGGIDSGLRPLPEALAEARSVAQHFSSNNLLIEQDATLESLRRELPHFEIFHYAGHASAIKGHTGLLLNSSTSRNRPAVFDSAMLEQLTLPELRLAVLSACSTEKTSDSGLLDSQNLARAFLRAGVPSVVATRWNIDSEVSAELMRLFYDKLLSGKSAAWALNAAEIELRQKNSHPYYWAGFDALGRD